MTTFEIPSGVTYIDKESLYNCWALSSLTVAEGNAYYEAPGGCNAIIEKATNKLIIATNNTKFIPSTVTEIGERAFYNLVDVNISIPSTVHKIGRESFAQCRNCVITANYNSSELSNVDVAADAFFNSDYSIFLRVPANTKSDYLSAVGWDAFSPDNVFEGNVGMEFTEDVINSEGTVSMTFTVTSDGDSKTVKVGCLAGDYNKTGISKNTTLRTITVPETVTHDNVEYSVTGIGKYAFYYCTNIWNLEIPASITTIEGQGITHCYSLEGINVANNNLFYESPDGCNAIIEKATHKLIAGSKGTRIIPTSVTEIAEEAFDGVNGIDVAIPVSVRFYGYAQQLCLM